MADFICDANMPVLPDPATTIPEKVPAKQFFSASVNGVEVVPETDVPLTDTKTPSFPVSYDDDVAMVFVWEGPTGLRSGLETKTAKAPSKPVPVIPPDVPGDPGEVRFTPVVAEAPPADVPVVEAAPEVVAEATT
jgi:hypothetical protein